MTGPTGVTPDYLRQWGRRADGSPLYRRLAGVVADDPELLRLINRIEHRPEPNVLFAAVHYLLMSGAETPLRDFYPTLVDEPRQPDDVAEAFREFVLGHEDEIVEIGRTRYTQTNECKRCVALLPAVWLTGLDRFHLVEVGASAGLNLALDRYRYRWGEVEWGPADSPVVLETSLRRGSVVPREIEVISRVGLDLDPVDVSDAGERAWLTALIWPEHHERRRRLERALEVVSGLPSRLVAGDAARTLPEVLAGIPAGEPVVVMNSMSLAQFDRTQRESVYSAMEREAAVRPLRRVSFEFLAAGDEWVTVSADRGAGLAQVGIAQPHGEWLELYARP